MTSAIKSKPAKSDPKYGCFTLTSYSRRAPGPLSRALHQSARRPPALHKVMRRSAGSRSLQGPYKGRTAARLGYAYRQTRRQGEDMALYLTNEDVRQLLTTAEC